MSVAVLLVAAGGWGFSISIPIGGENIVLRFASDGGGPAQITLALFVVSGLLFAWAVIWFLMDRRCDAKRQVVVVEVRGLRDFAGALIETALPRSLRGCQPKSLLIKLSQGVRDGVIVDPAAALRDLETLPASLRQLEGGVDRNDCMLVYGGLAPVPFTFLTGMLIDDETSVLVMDWDRHTGRWRELDGLDDGQRFLDSGIGSIGGGLAEVALAVSVSYQVDLSAVREKLPGLSIVELSLPGGTPHSHWAEKKQAALGIQFLESVIALGNAGVERIHLFLAAPNSVVFRLGRLYDRRNLPETVVYQYERVQSPRFPWGVRMPGSGDVRGAIVN